MNELIINLDRIACAARVLIYAHDRMPGDDLGQEARAVAMLALRSALQTHQEAMGDPAFDAAAALEEYQRRYATKEKV